MFNFHLLSFDMTLPNTYLYSVLDANTPLSTLSPDIQQQLLQDKTYNLVKQKKEIKNGKEVSVPYVMGGKAEVQRLTQELTKRGTMSWSKLYDTFLNQCLVKPEHYMFNPNYDRTHAQTGNSYHILKFIKQMMTYILKSQVKSTKQYDTKREIESAMSFIEAPQTDEYSSATSNIAYQNQYTPQTDSAGEDINFTTGNPFKNDFNNLENKFMFRHILRGLKFFEELSNTSQLIVLLKCTYKKGAIDARKSYLKKCVRMGGTARKENLADICKAGERDCFKKRVVGKNRETFKSLVHVLQNVLASEQLLIEDIPNNILDYSFLTQIKKYSSLRDYIDNCVKKEKKVTIPDLFVSKENLISKLIKIHDIEVSLSDLFDLLDMNLSRLKDYIKESQLTKSIIDNNQANLENLLRNQIATYENEMKTLSRGYILTKENRSIPLTPFMRKEMENHARKLRTSISKINVQLEQHKNISNTKKLTYDEQKIKSNFLSFEVVGANLATEIYKEIKTYMKQKHMQSTATILNANLPYEKYSKSLLDNVLKFNEYVRNNKEFKEINGWYKLRPTAKNIFHDNNNLNPHFFTYYSLEGFYIQLTSMININNSSACRPVLYMAGVLNSKNQPYDAIYITPELLDNQLLFNNIVAFNNNIPAIMTVDLVNNQYIFS